jgi:hypothetical protein
MFQHTARTLNARRASFLAPHDPTIMYLPAARALNQRDPTLVEIDEKPAGVEGFFDGLPAWVLPVTIGAAILLVIYLLTRKRG